MAGEDFNQESFSSLQQTRELYQGNHLEPLLIPIEQLQGHRQYNSDIYAVGIIGIQVLTAGLTIAFFAFAPRELVAILSEEYEE